MRKLFGSFVVFVASGFGGAEEPLPEVAYLKGDAGHSLFAWSLTIERGTLAIGAFFGEAVIVFERRGDSWVRRTRLEAEHGEFGDRFGSSVALSGDTMVIGASQEDGAIAGVDGDQETNSQPRSGAAYVFERDAGGSWGQRAYLKASNPEGTDRVFGTGDKFGGAVAISGDTIAVSACGESSGAGLIDGDQSNNEAPGAGAVYVFVWSGNTWTQQAYVKSPEPEAGDSFGNALGLDGNTLAVAAYREDGGTLDPTDNSRNTSGAVYLYERVGSIWKFIQGTWVT